MSIPSAAWRTSQTQTVSSFPGMKEDHLGATRMHKSHSWCMVAIALLFVLGAVFLSLYVSERLSNPVVKWRECEDTLLSQTSRAHEQLRSLRGSVEAAQQDLEEAKREKGQLEVHLVAVNHSLVETKDGWDACLNQLDSLKGNFSSQAEDVEQEREKHRVTKEKVEQLQQELQRRSQELENVQRALQQEREKHRTEIQKHNAGRKTQDPNRSNGKATDGPHVMIFILILLDVAILLAFP